MMHGMMGGMTIPATTMTTPAVTAVPVPSLECNTIKPEEEKDESAIPLSPLEMMASAMASTARAPYPCLSGEDKHL